MCTLVAEDSTLPSTSQEPLDLLGSSVHRHRWTEGWTRARRSCHQCAPTEECRSRRIIRFITSTYHHLERCLEGRAESAADDVVLREHVVESAQEVLNCWAAFRQVDEQVSWLGQEDVVDIGHDQHTRVSGTSLRRVNVAGRGAVKVRLGLPEGRRSAATRQMR